MPMLVGMLATEPLSLHNKKVTATPGGRPHRYVSGIGGGADPVLRSEQTALAPVVAFER